MKYFIISLIFLIALSGTSLAFDGSLPGLTPEETIDYNRLKNDPENIYQSNKEKVKQFDALEEKRIKARAAAAQALPKPVPAAEVKSPEQVKLNELQAKMEKAIEATEGKVKVGKTPEGEKIYRTTYNARPILEEMPFPKTKAPLVTEEPLVRWRVLSPRPPMSATARSFVDFVGYQALRMAARRSAPYAQRALPSMVISNPKEDLDQREERLKAINRMFYLSGPSGTGYYISYSDRIKLEAEKKELERSIMNSRNLEWMQRTGGI